MVQHAAEKHTHCRGPRRREIEKWAENFSEEITAENYPNVDRKHTPESRKPREFQVK